MESFVGNTRPFFQGLPTSTRGYEGSTLRDQTQAPPTPTPPATPTLPPAHGYNPYTAGLTSSASTTTLPGSLTPSRPITPATPSHKPHDHSVTSLLHPPTSKTTPAEARYMAKFEQYRHPMARPSDPLHDARSLAHSYGSQSGLTVENPLPRPYSSQPPQSSVSKALPRPYSSQAPSLEIRPSRPYSTQPAVGADARIPSRPYSTSHSTSSGDLRAYQYPFSASALVTDPRVHLDPRFLERSESRSLDSRSLEARPDPRGVPRPEQWGPGYRPDIKSLERQTSSVHIAAPVTVNGSKDALYLGKRSEDVASVRRQEESYARRSSELLQVNGSRDPLYPNGPQSTFPPEAQRTPSSERPKDSRPKEDSALDLSVKTVRQTPDSTAPDPEKNYSISPINPPVEKTVQNETPKRTPNSTPVSSPYNRDSSLAQYVELQKHNPGISGTRATPPSHLTPHYGLSTPTSPLPSSSPIARAAHILPPAKRSGDPLYAEHFAKLPKLSHTPPNKSPTPRHLTEGHLAIHPRDKALYGVTREDPNRGLNLLAAVTEQDGRYGHDTERRHSTDRKDPNSDWRDASLERRDKGESSLALREAERRERSLERRDLSLERREVSAEHREVSIERRDLAIERRNASSERRDPSLEKRDLSLDKRELDSKYLYSKHPDVKLAFDQYRAWVPSSEYSKSDSSAIDRPKYLPGQHSVPTSVPTTLPQQGSSVSPAQPPHHYTSYGRPHDSRLPQTQFPQLGQPSAHHQASAAQSSYPKIHQPYLPTPTTRAQHVPVSSSSSHPSEPLHPPVSQTLHYPYSSSHSYSQAVAAQYQQQQQHQKQQRLSSQYPPFSVPQNSKAGSTSALPSPHQAYAYAHQQQRNETLHAAYSSKRQSQISPHPSVSPHPSLSPHPTASPHPSASPHPAASPHSTVSPHTSHQGLSSSQYSPHPSQRPPAVSVSQHSAHSYPGTLPPSPYSGSQSHSAHTTPPSSRPSSATPQQPHAPQSLPSHPPHSSRQSSHSTSAYSTPPHHAHPTQPQHASARENQGKQGHSSQASSVEPHASQPNSRQSQSHPPPPPALHPSHSHHPSQPYPPHHSSQPYPHPPHPSQPYAPYHTSSYPPPPQPYSLSSHPSQPYPPPHQYHSSQPHPPNHHPHHHTPALHPSHPHAPPLHPSYHPTQVHPPPHHPSYPSQPSQTSVADSHQSTAPSHTRNTPAPSQPPRPPSSTKGPPPPVLSSQAPPTSSSQQTAPTPTPTPTPPTQSLPTSSRSSTPSQPPPATSSQSEPSPSQQPPPSSQPTPTAPSQPPPPSSTSQPHSSSSQSQASSAQHPPKSPSHPLPPPAVSQAHGVPYSHQQPHPSPASSVQSHPPAHTASTQSNPLPPSTQASTSHHHHSSHPHLHSLSNKSHLPPTQPHPPTGQPHLPPSQSHPSAHLPPTHLHHPPAHPLPPAQSHPSQPYPHYPSQSYYSHPHHSQTYAPQSHSSTHHSSQSHPSYPHHPTGHPPQSQQPHAPPLRSHPSQGGHLPPPHSSPMHLPQVRHPHPHGPGMYPPHPPQQSSQPHGSHPGPPHPSQPHVQGYPPHPQQPHYKPHSSVKAESGSHYPAHYPYPHQAGQSHDLGPARGPAVTSPPQSVKGKACQDLDPSRIRTKGEQKSFDSRNAESGKVNTDSWTKHPSGTQSAPQIQQVNDQVTYNSTKPLHQPHLASNQEVPKVFDCREEGAQKTDHNVQGNKSLEPGKAALADKLHKKLGRAESAESLVVKKETEPIKKKEEVPEQKDEWGSGFDKLLEDLAANPEGVTSRKSKTLGARYLQKVQIQHAIDNDLIVPPPAAIVEEEDESEPEPPVKFRGKFKSIKDKKVERVILTYASHSDESATEMIPDEDASDFEEELKREIRSKDKKRAHLKKPRRDSSSGSEGDIKDSDRRKGRRGKNKENKPNNKQDSDYSVSSSSSSVSDSSSSLSSDDSDSDDSESEEPVRPRRKGKVYSDSDTSRKKPKRCGRKWDSDSSDSEEEIIPRRRTRRRRKSSSDEDSYKPSQRNKKRKKKQDSSDSDEVPLKAKRGKKSKKSDSDDEEVSATRRGRKKGRIANGKKKNRQRDDSDDESDEKALPRKTRGMKKKQQEAKGRNRKRSSSSESSSSESEEEDNIKRKKQVEQKRKGNKKCGKILEDSSEDSELPTKYKNHAKSSLIVDSDDSDDDSKKESKETEDEKLKGQEDVEDKKDESSEKTDIENEAKDETQPEEDTLDFSEDFETNVESDSVIEKLNKLRNEELNREDVLEMKAWFGEVNSELKNQLKNVQDISYRNCWKKPQFGAGDDFQHGWQTDVKKYKELTARLPKKLCVSVKHQEINSSRASSRNGRDRETGKDSPSRHGSSSPAKNTRSKSGIIKTSMAVAEDDKLKVASRPEISSVMQRFFEKVLAESGNDVISKGGLGSKKFNLGPFPPYGAQRVPTGLTPTPSVAPSMLASDDSDLDSLASIRTDLPASDSVPVSKRSIASSLLKKIGRKYNDKKLNTLCLNKPRNILEATNKPQLLPTPGMPTTEKDLEDMSPDQMKLATFFRKETVSNYRDNFEVVVTKNGINEFTPILYQSRTRTKTKQIQDAATVKSVFGADIPPHLLKKVEAKKAKKTLTKKGEKKDDIKCKDDSPTVPVSRASTPGGSLRVQGDDDDDSELRSERSESVLGESSTPSVIKKSRRKLRKFRSGFDYIRKKKKVKPDDEATPSRKRLPVRKHVNWPEESRDVAAEVRSWVVNKGLGETVLHKAARLQYHDVVVYCAESPDFDINVRDNAGYTPLHEACNRGHLDIAQVLCAHGAHVNAPGYKGMRPLHEAVENGHAELARLLLAYGADPMLTTYAGQTCLDLCADVQCTQLIEGFLADLKGHDGEMWHFSGPVRFSDPEEQGCDIFSTIPVPVSKKSEETVTTDQDTDSKPISDSVITSRVKVDEGDNCQTIDKEENLVPVVDEKSKQSVLDKEPSLSVGEIITVENTIKIKTEPNAEEENSDSEQLAEKTLSHCEKVRKINDEKKTEVKEESESEEGWDLQAFVFEISNSQIPDTYEVEGRPYKYLLLFELLGHLKVTQQELIIAAKTVETLELSPEEFEKQAHCCIVGSCSRALVEDCSTVVLVKITPSLEKLLGIETVRL